MSIAEEVVLSGAVPRIALEDEGIIEVRAGFGGFRGVFAVGDIACGAVIVPDWHGAFYESMPGWRRFSVAEIHALPEAGRALVIRYGLDRDFDSIYGPIAPEAVTTLDNYINHSCEPNLGYDLTGNVIAERHIAADEELTLDYGCFAVNLDEAWECECGTASCRKRVRSGDWRMLAKTRGRAMPLFLRAFIPETGLNSVLCEADASVRPDLHFRHRATG